MDDLRNAIRARGLSNLAVPREIKVIHEIPRLGTGKINHRELEKIVLTKWELFWKKELSQFYGDQLHEGHYFEPVMREIEAFIDQSQKRVSGAVTVSLKPYQCYVESCDSPYSLASSKLGTYGEEAMSWSGEEAKGFAKIGSISEQLWVQAGVKR